MIDTIPRLAALGSFFLLVAVSVPAEEADPQAILDATLENYRTIKTLTARGKAQTSMKVNDQDVNSVTEFSLKIGRPNRYLIEWESQMPGLPDMPNNFGAVWNAGEGPYHYLNFMGTTNKAESDSMALAAVAGVCGGVSTTLPPIMFDLIDIGGNLLVQLKEPKLAGEEEIGGESCHVIKAGHELFTEPYTLWISKDRHLLRKISHGLAMVAGRNPFDQEISDEEIIATMKSLGQDPTEDAVKQMRRIMEEQRDQMKAVTKDLQGEMTEFYEEVDIGSELTAADFEYEVPAAVESSPYNNKFKAGDRAPNFEAPLFGGGTLKLSSLRGQVVFIDFWATWCAPCVAELPNVERIWKTYKDKGLVVIGVSLDSSEDRLANFLEDHPAMTWPQVFEGKKIGGAVSGLYGIEAIPHTLLLDGTGQIRHVGLRGEDLERSIRQLTASAGAKSD